MIHMMMYITHILFSDLRPERNDLLEEYCALKPTSYLIYVIYCTHVQKINLSTN